MMLGGLAFIDNIVNLFEKDKTLLDYFECGPKSEKEVLLQ